MRITSTREKDGTVYRIYRESDRFILKVKRLIPFITEAGANVSIVGSEDDLNIVLVVGPLDALLDVAFRKRMETEDD